MTKQKLEFVRKRKNLIDITVVIVVFALVLIAVILASNPPSEPTVERGRVLMMAMMLAFVAVGIVGSFIGIGDDSFEELVPEEYEELFSKLKNHPSLLSEAHNICAQQTVLTRGDFYKLTAEASDTEDNDDLRKAKHLFCRKRRAHA